MLHNYYITFSILRFLFFLPGVAYLGVARAFNLYPFSLILAKNNNITSDQSSIASN